MIMLRILVLFTLFVFAAASSSCGESDLDSPRNTTTEYVSLVQLLNSPGEFEDAIIDVTGYLQFDSNLRLYLTRDHAEAVDIRSSIQVIDDSSVGSLIHSECTGMYVRMKGKLYSPVHANFIIIDVQEVVLPDDSSTCWMRE